MSTRICHIFFITFTFTEATNPLVARVNELNKHGRYDSCLNLTCQRQIHSSYSIRYPCHGYYDDMLIKY